MELPNDVLLRTDRLRTNFYTFEGTVRALNGVSMEVKRGETLGLVGESGCGKSVTVRSIAQVVQEPGRIEAGSVYFAGRAETVDLLAKDERYMTGIRGNDISMIFQEAGSALNPVLSIGDQIGESLYFHRLPEMLSRAITDVGKGGAGGRGNRRSVGSSIGRRAETDDDVGRSGDGSAGRGAGTDVRSGDGSAAPGDPDGRSGPVAPQVRQGGVPSRGRLGPFVSLALRLLQGDARHIERGAGRPSAPTPYRAYFGRLVGRLPIVRRYRRRVEAVVRGEVIALLRDLGVPNPEVVVDRYPHELSGGMQQRVVIAIALACNPTLLIADEPTSNLDVTIQAQILALIKELKRTRIESVLFITHDLGVVAEVCDRVTVMYAGDVCETAKVRDLFHNPRHPYTEGLLASVPKEDTQDSLATIPGAVPNLVHPPAGCRFHPRCPYATDRCGSEKPAPVDVAPGHTVACFRYTDASVEPSVSVSEAAATVKEAVHG